MLNKFKKSISIKQLGIPLLLIMSISNVFATGVSSTDTNSGIINGDPTDKKAQVIPQLESAFNQQSQSITINRINTPINWSKSGINLKINSQWQLTISSQNDITISKIGIAINGVTVSNQVKLSLSPTRGKIQYLFAADNLQQHIQIFTKGYSLLGIVPQVSANDYLGYHDYSYKVVLVTLDYNDARSYNESTTNFLLVYAK